MTEEIFKADYEGILNLAGNIIKCAVLPNKKRVIVQREISGLLTGNKKGGFDRYFKPENLKPYIPEKFIGKTLDQSTLKNLSVKHWTSQLLYLKVKMVEMHKGLMLKILKLIIALIS